MPRGAEYAALTAGDEDSRASQVPGPATVAGQWLQAVVLGRQDRRNELARRLSQPTSDDMAVVDAACQRASRRYFGLDYDVRAVTRFAEQLREISGEDLGGVSWRPRS